MHSLPSPACHTSLSCSLLASSRPGRGPQPLILPAPQCQARGRRQPQAASTSWPVRLQDYPKPLVDHQEVHKANIQRHKDAYAHQEEVGERAEQVTNQSHLGGPAECQRTPPTCFMGQLRCSAVVSHHTAMGLPQGKQCLAPGRVRAGAGRVVPCCVCRLGCLCVHETQGDCRMRLLKSTGPALQNFAASAVCYWAQCQSAGGAHLVPMLPPVLVSKRGPLMHRS